MPHLQYTEVKHSSSIDDDNDDNNNGDIIENQGNQGDVGDSNVDPSGNHRQQTK